MPARRRSMASSSMTTAIMATRSGVHSFASSDAPWPYAFAFITAIRREVVSADNLTIRLTCSNPGSMCVVTMGAPDEIDAFTVAAPSTLERFDEWRGGSGLSLAIARRVIGQHGGSIFAPPGGQKAGAVVLLPQS